MGCIKKINIASRKHCKRGCSYSRGSQWSFPCQIPNCLEILFQRSFPFADFISDLKLIVQPHSVSQSLDSSCNFYQLFLCHRGFKRMQNKRVSCAFQDKTKGGIFPSSSFIYHPLNGLSMRFCELFDQVTNIPLFRLTVFHFYLTSYHYLCYQSAQVAITRCHSLGDLNNRNLFSQSSEG